MSDSVLEGRDSLPEEVMQGLKTFVLWSYGATRL